MGPGFESQQDHASNLGAGFLRFTKEIPRLFILIQFVLLTKASKVYLSTTAKNPIYRRCVSSNCTTFAVRKDWWEQSHPYCTQNGRPRWTSVGFLKDSQFLEFLGHLLGRVDDLGKRLRGSADSLPGAVLSSSCSHRRRRRCGSPRLIPLTSLF